MGLENSPEVNLPTIKPEFAAFFTVPRSCEEVRDEYLRAYNLRCDQIDAAREAMAELEEAGSDPATIRVIEYALDHPYAKDDELP